MENGYDPIIKANTSTKPTFCSGKHKVIGEDCSTAAHGVTVKSAITKSLPFRDWTIKQPVFDISDAFEGYINPGCASCSLINTADNSAISDPLIEVGKQPKWPVSFALNEESGQAHSIKYKCEFLDSSSTVLESNPITVTQNAKSDCTDARSTVTMTSGTPESWSYSVSAEGLIEYSLPISDFASIAHPEKCALKCMLELDRSQVKADFSDPTVECDDTVECEEMTPNSEKSIYHGPIDLATKVENQDLTPFTGGEITASKWPFVPLDEEPDGYRAHAQEPTE